MKKSKLYLDTSIISFLYAEDSIDFKNITIDFFDNYSSDYKLFISEIVLLEINKTQNNDLKIEMLNAIEKYNLTKLEYNEEIDILLSWNFKHLANIKKEHKIIIENSEALKRVLKWKEEIFNEVKHLDLKKRFKEIHKMAEKINNEKIPISK